MAYRLPTNLGSLVPPPAEQVQQRRPWRGVLTLTFMNAGQGASQDVYVTATETDGERYVPNASKVFRTGPYPNCTLVEWTFGLGDSMCI
jgi:hypothetical protein